MDTLTPRHSRHFLEGEPPALPSIRRLRADTDSKVMMLAGAALCCTLATVLGAPGPDAFFEAAAPALGLVLLVNALIGMGLEAYRGGFARTLLAASALGFAGIGAAYAGSADPWRVLLGCLAPAVLCAVGAVVLGEERRIERRQA